MGTVVLLQAFGRTSLNNEALPRTTKTQSAFKPHERRTLGDIRTRLVQMGFSHNPILNISAFPNDEGENNRFKLSVDVAQRNYQAVFGEYFDITITKYREDDKDLFQMETPLTKSSGSFCDVIRFVENFISTNLQSGQALPKSLVATI